MFILGDGKPPLLLGHQCRGAGEFIEYFCLSATLRDSDLIGLSCGLDIRIFETT